MPLFTAPKHFVQRLQEFDPLLRIRFSDYENRYRIERKVRQKRNVDGLINPEERIAAHDGYECVLKVRANQLDARVFYTLWWGDIQRIGGPDAYMAQLDREDAAREEQRQTRFLDLIETATRDRYNYMNRVRVVPEAYAHTAPPGGMSIND